MVYPSVTPVTRLATSVRDNPCNERLRRSSSGLATTMAPSSSRETLIGSATARPRVPLGPLTDTFCPSIVTSTPDGTGTGCFPIRDIALALPHHTYARTSPPTPSRDAWRSVRRPDDVEMIATPRPPRTRGRLVDFAYTRRPGLDTRRRPAMLRSRLGPYFSCTTSDLPTRASSVRKLEM